MNTFVNALGNQEARTLNGMKAKLNTGKACVDLFSAIGAMRGKDVVPTFAAAFGENPELALRIALWARDAREGSGERKIFRDILSYLETVSPSDARRLIARTPELGRWDDLLVVQSPALFSVVVEMIGTALKEKNGLAAKWMPRKGPLAAKLRAALGMTPKQYRKTLVTLTNVVETQMCANNWSDINFEHVPSVASARYKRAFKKHVPELFDTYTTKAVAGEAKVNAGAVYPYDVLKTIIGHYVGQASSAELNHIRAQWAALPNYMDGSNVLPVVDVSGSMTCSAGGSGALSCLAVAVSLGLYCADKNPGAFKDVFVTFSESPSLQVLKGDIVSKVKQMVSSNWGMSTNLHAVFEQTLALAVKNKVPVEDMPSMILIMSDMQFNGCIRFDDSAYEMIQRKYEAAGYPVPQVVFWNLNDYGNKPVSHNQKGVALVSGFSPAILKSVLKADLSDFTPEGIMMKTVMVPRYDV